jgi:large subunit ribosomal protein LP2
MKVVAAYLLAVLGGNDHPSVKDVKKVLSSVGADAEDSQIQKLIDEVADKDVFEVIESGRSKLASVPTGGAVSSGAASSGAATTGAPAAEEKKEESESEEESDEDAFGGLF